MPLKRAAAILYTELTMQPFPGYGLNDLYLSTLLLLLPKSNYPIKRVEIDFYKTVPRWKLTWFPGREETWRKLFNIVARNDLSVNNNCNQFLATALLRFLNKNEGRKKEGKRKRKRGKKQIVG